MAAARYSRFYTYIKPVTENEFVKSSASYIFSIITITILIVFAIRPTVSTISNLQKSLENDKQVLENLTTKTRNLSEAKRNLDNLSLDTKMQINTAVPERSDITTLIASLQMATPKEATISALQFEEVTIVNNQPLSSPPTTSEVKFIFNIQGTYPQITTALENLKNSPRIISIDTIDMTKQSSGSILLSISGKGYFLK